MGAISMGILKVVISIKKFVNVNHISNGALWKYSLKR